MIFTYYLITPLVAKILVIGLCFFIITNAVAIKNYIRKAFWIFVIGFLFVLYFMLGFIFDLIKNPSYPFVLEYFSLPIIVLIYTLILSSIFWFIGKKANMHFTKYKISHRKVEKHLLILYKYENNYLFKTEKNNVFLDSTMFRLGKFFHDEEIEEYLTKKKITYHTKMMVGRANEESKKILKEYYCYLVDVSNTNNYLQTFKLINEENLLDLNTPKKMQELIIRIVIKKPFEIKI